MGAQSQDYSVNGGDVIDTHGADLHNGVPFYFRG